MKYSEILKRKEGSTTSSCLGSGWEANDSQFLRWSPLSLEGKWLMNFGLSSEIELLERGQRQIANLTLGHGQVVVIECSAKYLGACHKLQYNRQLQN